MTDTVENQEQKDDNIAVPVEILNVQDLVDIANLIDVVTQRGAFRADELSAAGALYDKLKTFLATLMPKEGASEETDNKVEGTYEFKGE
jgi:hypothetical protein